MAIIGILFSALFAAIFLSASYQNPGNDEALGSFPLVVPTLSYGLEVERFGNIEYQTATAKSSIKTLMRMAAQDRLFTERMESVAKNKAMIRSLEGLPNAIFYDKKGKPAFAVQVINAHEFVRIDLVNGTVAVEDLERIQAEFEMVTLLYNGNVDSMLAYSNFDEELSLRIERSLKHDLPLDSNFDSGIIHLVYSVKRDEEGVVVGYGDVEAMRYRIQGEDKTAIRFQDQELDVTGFFSPDGSPAQRTWLPSPVPGARISSTFDLKRKHPVLNTIQPHYGTDFAAPYGTPVLAVSDGIVVARSSTTNNGNFIKIKHDDTYQTQYLHLKGFASGIRPGTEVSKGQVIGYVGSTGLSSGPHVCFRFWKNEQQIDPRSENLLTTEELTEEAMTAFRRKRAEIKAFFDNRA